MLQLDFASSNAPGWLQSPRGRRELDLAWMVQEYGEVTVVGFRAGVRATMQTFASSHAAENFIERLEDRGWSVATVGGRA